MTDLVCPACGYVRQPQEITIGKRIEPDTKFEDIPAEWSCPECGVTKDELEEFQSK